MKTTKYSYKAILTGWFYNAITHLRRLTLGIPKKIPIRLLLFKTTTCLTQPATTYFGPQNEEKTVYNKH